MIQKARPEDSKQLYFIINEAARAYEGSIPDDCYHQPYMTMEELRREMERITFFVWEVEGGLVGAMGLEQVKDVTLIRHAYVLPEWQKQGIGSKLLHHLISLTTTPRFLIGTWAGAGWALGFYQKRGFELLPNKDELLRTYWDIPQRQVETSVVLGIEIAQFEEKR